jgi:RES domain-containing protein
MGNPQDQGGGLGTQHPERNNPLSSAATGVAGAAGREQSVQGLLSRSYRAGLNAPQSDFDGEVYRGIKSRYTDTFLDHTKGAGSGGRFNAPGQSLIYTSPSEAAAVGEAGAYEGMAGRTLTRSQYTATVDPATGRGL